MTSPLDLTGEDLARWRRLVRISAHCASHPRAAATELGVAAKRAQKARVPGRLSRENVLVRLMSAARDYAAFDAVGRAANAPELADLVAEARPFLARFDPAADPEPVAPPRFRADLDG